MYIYRNRLLKIYIYRELFSGVNSVKTCPICPVYSDSNSLLYYLYHFFIYLIVIWSFDRDESNVTGQLVSEQLKPVI